NPRASARVASKRHREDGSGLKRWQGLRVHPVEVCQPARAGWLRAVGLYEIVSRGQGYRAGKIVPSAVPKPTLNPSPSAYAVMITASPSCRNVLVSPPGRFIGFSPRHVNSSRLPKVSGVGPEIVPDAIRSPGRRLHPLTV